MHTAQSGARTQQSGTETDNAASWNRNRHKLQAGPGATQTASRGRQPVLTIGMPLANSYLTLVRLVANSTCPRYAAKCLLLALGVPLRNFHLPSICCWPTSICHWDAASQFSLALDTLPSTSNLPLASRSAMFTCPRYAAWHLQLALGTPLPNFHLPSLCWRTRLT